MKRKIVFLITSALMIALDQWSKFWIVANLKGHENIVWIKNVFELEYVENTGAAFSSFTGKQAFLLTITSLILILAFIEFFRIPDTRRYNWLHFGFTLLISGAIGNMIDRVRQGYVVDFLYFVPINFPRFNVADCYVTVCIPLFMILLFAVYKDEETEFLFKFKKN